MLVSDHIFTSVFPQTPHIRNQSIATGYQMSPNKVLTTPGSTSSLILAFFAPNSPFHAAILQWRRGDPTPNCQAVAPSEDIWTGASGSLGAGSCSDTEHEFWDSLSDIESLHGMSGFGNGNLMDAREKRAPRRGEGCEGPVGVCATEEGCRCLVEGGSGGGAGESDGSGGGKGSGSAGRLYKATCQPSHFANDLIRPGVRVLRGEDPTPETGNPILRNLTSNLELGAQDRMAAICPCNATYVSEACCSARNGMVWEDAKMKVGELQPQT